MALTKDAIFIQGILARSGTNYLHELLVRHPDCCSTGALLENFFVMFADVLDKYVDSVQGRWKPEWQIDPSVKGLMWEGLGDGLVSFLDRLGQADGRNRGARYRLVARTPHVGNLDYFFRLFPRARLIVLVRDGRDLVESFVRSFKVPYQNVMQKWAEAARTIVEFDEKHRGSGFNYCIVRYEDVVTALEPELRRLFDFLALDPSRYDFRAAQDAPVIGSSTFRGGAAEVHWDPLPKTKDFDPLARSGGWTPELHEQFNTIAGEYLRHFGYPPRHST